MRSPMSNNVLSFPKEKIIRDVFDFSLMTKLNEQGAKNFADGLATHIINNIYEEFSIAGIDVNDLNFEKDFIFASEAIKALIYRAVNHEHPMQKLVDENVITDLAEDGDDTDRP